MLRRLHAAAVCLALLLPGCAADDDDLSRLPAAASIGAETLTVTGRYFDIEDGADGHDLAALEAESGTVTIDFDTHPKPAWLSPGLNVHVRMAAAINLNDAHLVVSIERPEAGSALELANLAQEEEPFRLDRSLVAVVAAMKDKAAFTDMAGAERLVHTGVDAYFSETTWGQLRFKRDHNGDGRADVYGLTVDLSSTGGCQQNQLADKATAQLKAIGVDLASYDDIVFIMPDISSCGWSGWSYIGSLSAKGVRSWVRNEFGKEMVTSHEIGHAIGLGHAATDPGNDGTIDVEYGDGSSVMGNQFKARLNAPQMVELKALDIVSGGVVAGSAATYTLTPLHASPTAGGTRVITLPKSSIGGKYYLSARDKTGIDAGIASTFAGRLSVHARADGNAQKSRLIKTLGVGEKLVDGSTTVEVTAVDAAGKVTVRVNGGGTPPTPPPPTPPTPPSPPTGCVKKAPTLSLAPPKATASRRRPARFALTVTNNNVGTACGTSTITLTAATTRGLEARLAPATLKLAPGAAGKSAVVVTASRRVPKGDYALTVTGKDSVSGEGGTASGQVTVKKTLDLDEGDL